MGESSLFTIITFGRFGTHNPWNATDERPYPEQPGLVEFIGGSKVFLDNGKIDEIGLNDILDQPLVLILIPRRFSYLRWMVDRRVAWVCRSRKWLK